MILLTRSSHYEEFSKQVMNVLNQWETDLQKTREAEEKLEVTVKLKNLFNGFKPCPVLKTKNNNQQSVGICGLVNERYKLVDNVVLIL